MKQIIIRSGNQEIRKVVSDEQYSQYWRPYWQDKKRRQRNYKLFKEKGYSNVSYDAIPYDVRSSFNVEDIILDNEQRNILVSALDILNDEEYQLIVTTTIDGMSLTDYSKLTGIPRTTLSSRRKKIFDKLREYLS